MRFTILTLILLVAIATLAALDWDYHTRHQPRLEKELAALLEKNGLPGITVKLDYFDATLAGIVPSPGDRKRAGDLIRDQRPVQALDWENTISIVPQVESEITGNRLTLSGWVQSPEIRADLLHHVREFRPELEIDSSKLQTSPRVLAGAKAKIGKEDSYKIIADLVETIRVPPSLSIARRGKTYVLTGHVKTEELRDAIRQAAEDNPGKWEIDSAGLAANRNVNDAPFSTGTALAEFVASFFRSPSPGEFRIDLRTGPYLKAYATAAMEAEWLTLLRPITGAARVKAEINRVPSPYHFPDYPFTSPVEPQLLPLVKMLTRSQIIRFDFGSSELRPDEVVKLGPLVPLLARLGPQVKFIVAAYADPAGEPGAETQAIQRARAVVVNNRLLQMGARPEQLEMMVFDKLSPPGVLSDDVRFDCRRVELLLK
jgi:outer membrane protein OmpA-like peptidoglycan-associated protein